VHRERKKKNLNHATGSEVEVSKADAPRELGARFRHENKNRDMACYGGYRKNDRTENDWPVCKADLDRRGRGGSSEPGFDSVEEVFRADRAA